MFARYGVQVLHWTPTSFPRTAMHSWTELRSQQFYRRGNDLNRPGMTGDVSNQFYNMCSWLSGSKKIQPFWYTSELMNYFFSWDRSDLYIYIHIFIYWYIFIFTYTIRPSSYLLWTWTRYPLNPPMLPQEAKDPIYLQERQVAKLQRSVIARNSGDMARNGLIGNAWDRVGW